MRRKKIKARKELVLRPVCSWDVHTGLQKQAYWFGFSVHILGGLWKTSILALIFSSQNCSVLSVCISFELLLDFSHLYILISLSSISVQVLKFCKCIGKKVVSGIVAISPYHVITSTLFCRLEYRCSNTEGKWRTWLASLLKHVALHLKVNMLSSYPAFSCVLSDLRARSIISCLRYQGVCRACLWMYPRLSLGHDNMRATWISPGALLLSCIWSNGSALPTLLSKRDWIAAKYLTSLCVDAEND